jgi:glycosyltransferase involved in cell wall biosynthesis
MKILYISPIKTNVRLGDSNHFLEIGENLLKNGNELLIICRGKEEKFEHLNIKYVPTIEIRFFTTVISEFLLTLYLSFYLFTFKPDIVYYKGISLGGIVSRIFKIPSVAEANGIYPDEIKIARPRFFELVGSIFKMRERMIYFSATRVICITEGIKKELVKNYGVKSEICRVIPNGANTNLFKPMDKTACRSKLGLKENEFYLGFIGSFRAWVGLDTLIEAMGKVREEGYNRIRCILVGDGSPADYLRKMVSRYNLRNQVIFTGKIRYEEVVVFINSFDVCLAPFKRERNAKIGISPLKLYEYLACARPVIGSRLQGITEVVDGVKCGYLFEPDHAEDLASRIIESFKERDRLPEMGINGRALVEKSFSWERIAQQVENVLNEAVELN